MRALAEQALATRWVLVAAVAVLVCGPVILAGELAARDSQDRFHRAAIAATADTARSAALEIEARLGSVKRDVDRVSAFDLGPAIRAGDFRGVTDRLGQLLIPGSTASLSPEIGNLWITDGAGRPIVMRNFDNFLNLRDPVRLPLIVEAVPPDVGNSDFFARAKQQVAALDRRSLVTRNVRFDPPFSAVGPLVVAPVRDGFELVGIIVAQLKTSEIVKPLRSHTAQVDDLVLFDDAGRQVAQASNPLATYVDLSASTIVQTALRGGVVEGDAPNPLGDGQRIVAVARVADTGWRIAAVTATSAAERDLADSLVQQRTARLGLTGIVLIGAVALAGAVSEVSRRRRALAQALERQTAVSDVLKIISRSPIQLEAVFDGVIASAVRLCRADNGSIVQIESGRSYLAAHAGSQHDAAAVNDYWATRNIVADRSSVTGRVLLERRSVTIADIHREPEFIVREIPGQDPRKNHSMLGVPLLREGEVVGVMVLRRREVKPFTSAEVALAETFASQAVIAIENARLFNETKESLGQQTALSDVLRTISRSAFDLDAVLQTIVERAAGLVGAESSMISRRDGDDAVVLAGFGPALPTAGAPGTRIPVSEATLIGRALLTGKRQYTVDATLNPDLPQDGPRTRLVIPFMRDGKAVGALGVSHDLPRPFSDRELQTLETFADQAAIAIENVRLFNETKEALEQQTALSEILRVIASSPASEQPVLQAIAENAARFCRAADAVVVLTHQNELSVAAHHGPIPSLGRPLALERSAVAGRAVLDGRTVHVTDILGPEGDEFPQARTRAGATGQRAMLAAPLLRDGVATGAIILRKQEPVAFTPTQIQLVEAFAHQAVIAIENVRLFNETKEALKQRTATSEILRVISETLGDPQPVMQAIVDTVLAVCSADSAGFFRRSGDDLLLRAVSGTWRGPRPSDVGPQLPFHGDSIVVSALEEGRYQHVADTSADPRYDAAAQWSRTRLAVPVLRGSETIGVIRVGRAEPGGFTEREIRLVEGFADQAAIAFENARLFNETKEALERQTSISDVLQTIGRSAFDLQPVLDTVVERAVKLCDAREGSISTLEDDVYRTRAYWSASSLPPAYIDFMRQEVRTPDRGSLTGRTALEGRVVHIVDVLEDPEYTATDMQQAAGYRTLLGVPLLRDGRVIGVFALTRSEVRPFSDRQIELVRTFADQAAIAIENTRLFVATKDALERQSAVAQVLGEISQSGFQLQPVLESVIEAATKLCAAQQGFIYRREGDVFRLVVAHGITPEFKAFTEANPINPMGRGTVTGRVSEDRKTVHIPDVLADREYTYWEAQRLGNFRAILGVPMMRDEEVIGVMLLWRTEPQPFTDEQIALVTTFANQATIAIENVRLFDETKESLAHQTAMGEVLKVISRSTFDVTPAIESVLANAVRLCDADFAWTRWSDRGSVSFEFTGRTPELTAFAKEYQHRLRDPNRPKTLQWDHRSGNLSANPDFGKSIMGRALAERATLHVSDITQDQEMLRTSGAARYLGVRTVLAVPLFDEEDLNAVILLARRLVRPFADREIQVIETFADQGRIAIQNVRLFNEIQDKSRQLEVASRHKSEFLANMSHELRTPLNAIIGFSEVLVQGHFGEMNEKQREYLNDVIGSGQHLLSLINDILDLSKIEAGRMELELSTFNFRDALQSGVTIVRERASRHNITLAVAVSDDLVEIEADERKVKQIMYNLLSNAVKFTADGGRVEVSVRRENGDVRVDVQDNGIGIAGADQARIFEEFQQVGRERSREGTGLGLTLTKRFVELHGGRIWLESAPGQGSTFTFTLPLRQAAPVRA